MDPTFYGTSNFDFVKDKQTREYLKSAHRAITICELWDWMRTYTPDNSFMWDPHPHPNIIKIRKEMFKDEVSTYHSGSSYALIMRQMETIAKYGLAKYQQSYMN